MIRTGLLGAGIGFIYVMSLTLLSPFCTFCITPFLGLGVGYMTGWFDKPPSVEMSLGRGGVAGGLTGFGVILGQMMATLVNGILVTRSEQLPELLREFGLSEFVITNSEQYWQATVTVNSFCGIFNLALIIGLGALGSMLWFQRKSARSLSGVSS